MIVHIRLPRNLKRWPRTYRKHPRTYNLRTYKRTNNFSNNFQKGVKELTIFNFGFCFFFLLNESGTLNRLVDRLKWIPSSAFFPFVEWPFASFASLGFLEMEDDSTAATLSKVFLETFILVASWCNRGDFSSCLQLSVLLYVVPLSADTTSPVDCLPSVPGRKVQEEPSLHRTIVGHVELIRKIDVNITEIISK